jgi:hypothetical protein
MTRSSDANGERNIIRHGITKIEAMSTPHPDPNALLQKSIVLRIDKYIGAIKPRIMKNLDCIEMP